MLGEKHRLRFEKSGNLRLLSHLDLMRSVERLCRRAQIDFKFSGGFHPQPRIMCALSLPLGIEGKNEVMEIELTAPLEAEVLLERMQAQAPTGLNFLSGYSVDPKTIAAARRKIYRLELTPNDVAVAAESIPRLLDQERVWSPRLKPRPRQVNIKPYLRSITVDTEWLMLDIWVTPYGTARADELIALLGLPSPYVTGAVIERSELELHDETYEGLLDAPPSGIPELKPLDISSRTVLEEPEPAMATWGLSPNGPVVE